METDCGAFQLYSDGEVLEAARLVAQLQAVYFGYALNILP